ncbi:MAG TPA: hypothetical protein VMX13_14560 [Sedimentisphaerales bacterium]|nr:hypothetical protein [Sedimentisphaerales bacterium]
MTKGEFTFAQAVKGIFTFHGQKYPQVLVDVVLRAAKVNDSGISAAIMKEPSGRYYMLCSSGNLMQAKTVDRKGGFFFGDKGSYYLNTGYQEFEHNASDKTEKQLVAGVILWVK